MARRRKKRVRGTRGIVAINSNDRDWTSNRFVLWFSTGGFAKPVRLLVWANHLEDALEEAVDWIVDNAPGILSDDYVEEEYKRLVAEGMSEEKAQEEAEMDMTCFGHSGYHCIPSENWGIESENPSRAELLELEGRPAERRAHGRDPLAKKRRSRR